MHLYKAVWIVVILKHRLYFNFIKQVANACLKALRISAWQCIKMSWKGEVLLEENIGIIGAGRLGKSLARHFPREINVYICDKDLDAAVYCAEKYNRISCKTDDIIEKLNYIFICVPPDEVKCFLEKYKERISESSLVVNMATSVDTKSLKSSFKNLEIIPLKPVAEAFALLNGLKGVFITDGDASGYTRRLSYIFKDLGEIITGNEMDVQQVNRIATICALNFYEKLEKELSGQGVPEKIKDAAVKSVATGTILGCPPDKDNYYIKGLMYKNKER